MLPWRSRAAAPLPSLPVLVVLILSAPILALPAPRPLTPALTLVVVVVTGVPVLTVVVARVPVFPVVVAWVSVVSVIPGFPVMPWRPPRVVVRVISLSRPGPLSTRPIALALNPAECVLQAGNEDLAPVVVGHFGLLNQGDGRHQSLNRRSVLVCRSVLNCSSNCRR